MDRVVVPSPSYSVKLPESAISASYIGLAQQGLFQSDLEFVTPTNSVGILRGGKEPIVGLTRDHPHLPKLGPILQRQAGRLDARMSTAF